METNILKLLTPTSPLLTLTRLTPPLTLTLPRALRIKARATNSDQSDNDDDNIATSSGIRFRSRSRKRAAKTEELDEQGLPRKTKAAPKKWEEMSFQEKALELYVGEKGALFWLNKFAYASIYIVIGAWICFRFVGPALNLYQLDGPPLSPSDVLKGSS